MTLMQYLKHLYIISECFAEKIRSSPIRIFLKRRKLFFLWGDRVVQIFLIYYLQREITYNQLS